MRIYHLIDQIPEMPYFILALTYILTHPVDVSLHVFSIAFIYLAVSVTVGLALKSALKTKRPVEYPFIPLARYDVPSLHTLVSVGAAAFVYFVDPMYSLITAPVSLLYMYSRIRLGFHTRMAVYVGSVLGLILGVLCGLLVWRLRLPGLETLLSVMFFIVPVSATVFRFRYLGGSGFKRLCG